MILHNLNWKAKEYDIIKITNSIRKVNYMIIDT